MTITSKSAGAVLLISLLGLLGTTAHAEKPRFDDSWTFSMGVMRHSGDGSVASSRANLPLDELTFADLNLDDDQDIFWARAAWQFAERWQARFSYSSFDSSGLNVQSTSGNFDGVEWEAGAFLASSLDLDLYIVDVTYDFVKTEKAHLGLGLGLHAADLDFKLLIGLFASAGGEEAEFVPIAAEDADFLAPLPNLAFGGGYRISKNVYLDGRAGWFSLSYDKYKGDLYSARAAVEWRPWERVGLGLGYQLFDIDVEVRGSRGTEIYDLKFNGPILFVSAGF